MMTSKPDYDDRNGRCPKQNLQGSDPEGGTAQQFIIIFVKVCQSLRFLLNLRIDFED